MSTVISTEKYASKLQYENVSKLQAHMRTVMTAVTRNNKHVKIGCNTEPSTFGRKKKALNVSSDLGTRF
jgi:hypothetical protein